MKPVRKAVVPAAGYGTRFLPATKAVPKEMLPVVDKPVIQYIVEEAAASGLAEVIMVTSHNKKALEDHFDYNVELDHQLRASGKTALADELNAIADMMSVVSVRQKQQLGNGHAVLCAKGLVDPDEPIVVLWGDDFIYANPPRVKQLIDVHDQTGGNVVSVIRSTYPEDATRYGFVSGEMVSETVMKVSRIVEKPGLGNAPSDLAMVSGCLLNPGIMAALEATPKGKGGEIWLVDAINSLIATQEVYAKVIENGKYYDCGNKLEYLKANIDFALKRPDMAPDLMEYLQSLVNEAGPTT